MKEIELMVSNLITTKSKKQKKSLGAEGGFRKNIRRDQSKSKRKPQLTSLL